MSLVNLTARKLDNGAILVSYQKDGKAKDAAFMCWEDFVSWLSGELDTSPKRLEGVSVLD